jgi:hypothetical protein
LSLFERLDGVSGLLAKYRLMRHVRKLQARQFSERRRFSPIFWQRSGRAGAISKSDVVAIDRVSFPGGNEREVADLGFRLRRVGFRSGDDGGTAGRRFQPPAVVQ